MIRRNTVYLLLLLLLTATAAQPAQDEEEEVNGTRIAGGKLVFTADEVYLSPDGAFVHASGECSIAFRDGTATALEIKNPKVCGVDEGISSVGIDRVEVRDDRVVIYPESGRVRNKAVRSVTLLDGRWENRTTGAVLVVEDGRIIKCKGLAKS